MAFRAFYNVQISGQVKRTGDGDYVLLGSNGTIVAISQKSPIFSPIWGILGALLGIPISYFFQPETLKVSLGLSNYLQNIHRFFGTQSPVINIPVVNGPYNQIADIYKSAGLGNYANILNSAGVNNSGLALAPSALSASPGAIIGSVVLCLFLGAVIAYTDSEKESYCPTILAGIIGGLLGIPLSYFLLSEVEQTIIRQSSEFLQTKTPFPSFLLPTLILSVVLFALLGGVIRYVFSNRKYILINQQATRQVVYIPPRVAVSKPLTQESKPAQQPLSALGQPHAPQNDNVTIGAAATATYGTNSVLAPQPGAAAMRVTPPATISTATHIRVGVAPVPSQEMSFDKTRGIAPNPQPTHKYMDSNQINLFMTINNSFFREDKLILVRQQLERLDESKFAPLQSVQYKNPTTLFLFSFFLGYLGVDRFMLGQTGLGILKLITFGGLGLWTFIDWFLIMGATRDANYKKFIQAVSLY
jgi:TM2 domain-containing membrane protein YozV